MAWNRLEQRTARSSGVLRPRQSASASAGGPGSSSTSHLRAGSVYRSSSAVWEREVMESIVKTVWMIVVCLHAELKQQPEDWAPVKPSQVPWAPQ